MPSQPVIFPATSSTLPYPLEASRSLLAAFIVLMPESLSLVAEDAQAELPVILPMTP